MACDLRAVTEDITKIQKTALLLQKTILEAKLYIFLGKNLSTNNEKTDIPAETKKFKENVTQILHTLETEAELDAVLNLQIEHNDLVVEFSALSLAKAKGSIYEQLLAQKIANAKLYIAVIKKDATKVDALIKAHGCKGDNCLDFEQIYPLTHHNTILAIAAGMHCPDICISLLEAGASMKPYYGRTRRENAREQMNHIQAIGEKTINGLDLLETIQSLKNDKLTQMAESAAKEHDGVWKRKIPSIIAFHFQCLSPRSFYTSIRPHSIIVPYKIC